MFFRRNSTSGSDAAPTAATTPPAPAPPAGASVSYALGEERALIDRSRRGDLAAFDRLVRQYERNVFNTAYRLSGSHEDAADIAQEAFVRAWNNLKSFRGDSAFSTWLYRIVTNVFLDDRKRKRARPHRSLEDVLTLDESTVQRQFEDPTPGPQDLAEGDERRKIVEEAIQTLPEGQRIMVVMYHTQGLSYEEIAEITQLPMGTVKSRLNRARLALRDRLSPVAELFNAEGSPT
jgi:RNA polymerase sigma-70 factor (ECF subfamily)